MASIFRPKWPSLLYVRHAIQVVFSIRSSLAIQFGRGGFLWLRRSAAVGSWPDSEFDRICEREK